MVTFIATIWPAQWSLFKRSDSLEKRIDEIVNRLDRTAAPRPPVLTNCCTNTTIRLAPAGEKNTVSTGLRAGT